MDRSGPLASELPNRPKGCVSFAEQAKQGQRRVDGRFRENFFKKSCKKCLTGGAKVRNILPRAARECGAAAALQGARRDLENRILERRNSNRIIHFYARCVPGPLEGDGFEMPAGGPARAPDGSGARPQN